MYLHWSFKNGVNILKHFKKVNRGSYFFTALCWWCLLTLLDWEGEVDPYYRSVRENILSFLTLHDLSLSHWNSGTRLLFTFLSVIAGMWNWKTWRSTDCCSPASCLIFRWLKTEVCLQLKKRQQFGSCCLQNQPVYLTDFKAPVLLLV